MTLPIKAVGKAGEMAAADYLALRGYRILEKNRRIGMKEADIICQIGEYLVFVEVKTRVCRDPDGEKPWESFVGRASGMVDSAKKRNLLTAVNAYMKRYSPPYVPRIDVIEVYLAPDRRVLAIEQIEGAVTGNTRLKRRKRP